MNRLRRKNVLCYLMVLLLIQSEIIQKIKCKNTNFNNVQLNNNNNNNNKSNNDWMHYLKARLEEGNIGYDDERPNIKLKPISKKNVENHKIKGTQTFEEDKKTLKNDKHYETDLNINNIDNDKFTKLGKLFIENIIKQLDENGKLNNDSSQYYEMTNNNNINNNEIDYYSKMRSMVYHTTEYIINNDRKVPLPTVQPQLTLEKALQSEPNVQILNITQVFNMYSKLIPLKKYLKTIRKNKYVTSEIKKTLNKLNNLDGNYKKTSKLSALFLNDSKENNELLKKHIENNLLRSIMEKYMKNSTDLDQLNYNDNSYNNYFGQKVETLYDSTTNVDNLYSFEENGNNFSPYLIVIPKHGRTSTLFKDALDTLKTSPNTAEENQLMDKIREILLTSFIKNNLSSNYVQDNLLKIQKSQAVRRKRPYYDQEIFKI